MLTHSLMLIYPTLFLVIQDELQLGFDSLGFIAFASSFMFGLGAIPAGYFERWLGGRNLLLFFQVGCFFSALAVGYSATVFQFTLSLIVLGFTAAAYHPAGLTLISRRVRPMGRGMAIHGITGSIGLALGPLLATTFTELVTWRAAYFFLAGLMGILALCSHFLIPRRTEKTDGGMPKDFSPEKTNRPALLYFYITAVLMGLAYNGFTTFMPTHFALNTGEFLSAATETFKAGFFPALVFLTGIIGQWIGGILADRFHRTVVLVWVVLFNIPFLLLMGFSQNHFLIMWSLFLGVTHFNFQPIANTLISELTPSHRRGLGYGINFFLTFGVGAAAAGFGGIIAEKLGVSYVFPVMGLCLIPALFSSIMVARKAPVSS